MLAAAGHPVIDLVRLSVGPLRLDGLRPGRVRQLTQRQVRDLYAATDPAGAEQGG